MVKHLLLLAFTAQTFFCASSTERISHKNRSCDSRSCRVNEIWVKCPDAVCVPKTCKDVGFPVPCYDLRPGGKCPSKPGCICKEGYVRNNKGYCIPMQQCPLCKNPNEIYDPCPAPCPPRKCGVNEALILCMVPPKLGDPECEPGCRCQDGFVRNYTGICIPKDQCPKCAKPNEVFDPCIAPCPPRRCDVDERVIRCAAPPKLGDPLCKAGCRCADGFKTNYEGICIPQEECPQQCPKNEWYSDCIQGDCSPQNCTQLGFSLSCPRIDPKNCKKGCLCEDGFVRNDRGICIPAQQCPSCGGDPNKVAGCGVFCNQRCRDIGKEPGACIDICYINACDCREGTFLDENTGLCVPPKQCSPQCPINERYSDCIQGGCSPQNCTQLGFPVPCPRIDPVKCKKGCLCKEGYVRDDRGVCIPAQDCPSCGGDPNKVTGCGVFCNQRCRDIGEEPGACITICYENACDCREGTFLDENTGLCVPPKQCSPQCPINERYSDCIQGDCSPQNCTQLGFPVPCPRIDPVNCKKGCLCKEGYVRNDRGVCIPAQDCPSCGGDPNKVAGCGVFCNQRCRDIGKEPNACIAICYENACDCREGTFLDENTGFCVPAKNCSPQCPPNEWYSECVQGNCSPENCSQLGFPIACPDINPEYCKKGCLCKQGYARNENGICIPSNECPSCRGDPNAQAGCGGYCNRRCSDIGKEPGACILICEINGCDCKEGYYFDENIGKCVKPEQCTQVCLEANNEVYSDCINGGCQAKNCSQYGKPIKCPKIDYRDCIKGCLCKKGYLRAINGKCAPETDCPGACNGPFEEYSECSYDCPPQTCESLDKVYACPIQKADNCKPMCRCKSGYYRNKIGQCITEEECRRCTGQHEYYSCGGACDNVCETLNEESQDNCPYVNVKCNEKCYCEKGYARAKNNTCIPISSCPSDVCGKNEVFNDCSYSICTARTCSELGFPLDCKSPCKKGCVCKNGYVRDKRGRCIPVNQCPSCGGDSNAKPGCGVNCGRRCSDIGKGPVVCPLICLLNGCDCKEGYYYDNNTKKCVKPENCSPVCLEQNNEVYSDCINGGCSRKNCSQYGKPVPCVKIDPKYCKKGCLCKEGYLRAANGKCVPQQSCPEACNGLNDEYNECSYDCPPQTCESLDKAYACPIMDGDNCKPMCRCKPGFFRNKIGECITEEQCRRCTGQHEYYSCGGACDNVCETLNEESQDNCPYVNVKCNEKCYCEKGYARAKNNTCIPISSCPSDICGKNEVFNDCSNSFCTARNCSELGFPLDCESPCQKGCVCKDGYVRDKRGRCIPVNQCPSCGGDSNAKSGCGVNCGRRCSDIGKGPVACPLICLLNGCDCKEGYYYDSNTKKCVKPENCSPVCLEQNNEVYSDCINGGCSRKNCSQYGKPVPCVKIDPKYCIKGCLCKEGYLRAANGKCVPQQSCPEACTGLNEEYNECSYDCPPQTCESLDRAYACPIMDGNDCKPMCRCKPGFFRDRIGQCITEEQCRRCMGPFEFYACGGACDNVCKTLHKQNQTNCPIINIRCNDMCYCEKDYARATNNTCIPITSCNEPQCPINERYEQCPAASCEPQYCSQLGYPVPCPLLPPDGKCPGKPGCVCIDGYVRDDNGKCIPKKDCPSCGGDFNAQTGCGVNCLQHCDDLQNPQRPRPCPKICRVNACDCKKGYYLDSNTNKCVLPEKCTKSCGKDEIYSSCINGGCDKRNCSQLGLPQICIDPFECFGGCICREGFLRLKNGTCVPYDQCPVPKCKKNERFELCPAKTCQPQSCSEFGFPLNCPAENDTCPGYPECICNYGYVRNDRGVCRPKEECTSCGGDSNARPGCGINCGKRCPNNNLNPRLCPRICLPNACDCKDGFYYDKNVKSCVKFEDCSPPCDELNNEEYDPCVNGGCGWRNCSQVGGPILCIDPITCNKGCKCKEDYYRLDNGTCVPENKCPVSCRQPNEVYDPCPPKCPPQTCESINAKYFCPIQTTDCVGKCRCKPNFFRNKIGECISKKNCLKCTGPNEFFSCGPVCDNVCSNLDTESQFNCPIKSKKCVSQCYCVDGFARNKSGICIPIDQCPARRPVTSKPTSKPNPSSVNTSVALANFEQGNQNLAAELLYQLYVTRPGENFMVSGFSLLIALAQFVFRAEGATAEQILHVMNLANKDEVETVIPIFIENFKIQKDVIFKLATKYYFNLKYPLSEGFVQDAEAIFGSEPQNLDFSNNVEAAKTMNDWVEDNTNGLIKDLIKADMLSVDTRCVLLNALYFLGNWEKQFNKNLTELRDFYTDNENSVLVKTMYQEGRFEYGESSELDCKILRLRYKGGNFSYVAFLPNERTGLSSLTERLRKPGLFANSLTLLRQETVQVYLPVMDIDTDISDLKQLLEKVNVTAPFYPSNDLNGILQSGESLSISDAIQKTKIKLDETGTEAAAATAVILMTYSALIPSETYIFNANHPFCFHIMNLNSVVFSGCYFS